MKSLLSCLLICIALPTLVFADYVDSQQLPDKAASKFVQPMLKAINSGDRKKIQAFIEASYSQDYLESFTMEELVAELLGIHQLQGELSYYASRDYTAALRNDQLHAIIKSEKHQIWLLVSLLMDLPSPKIYELGFRVVPPPKDLLEPGSIKMDKALKELDSFASVMAQMDLFSGAILLANKERVLYQCAFGKSDKHFNVANRIQTQFNIGGMSEMFTAIAIMQLVAEGSVSLDDKLSKFVDETWLAKEISNKITIRHLLSHSSGLDRYSTPAFADGPDDKYRELDSHKPLIREKGLMFEPGARSEHSNTGMFMLGVVIEAVSGQNYFNYIQDNIYRRAGMKHTGAFDMQQAGANFATDYFKEPYSEWQPIASVRRSGPEGGAISTVADLHRFALALTNHKLVKQELTESMLTHQVSLYGADFGYGIYLQQIGGEVVANNFAGFPGTSANLDIYLDSGYITIVLTNHLSNGLEDNGVSHILGKMRGLLSRIE